MDEPLPPTPRASFWRRRVLAPIVAQLTQGVTPRKIALTLALGLVCGLFPFLGLTTALCFAVAFVFKLNQPIIHVINQLLWPVQLPLIAVYVKAGARLYGADVRTFNVEEITRVFWASQREFWVRFGIIGIYAFSAWLISVPVIAGLAYFATLPALRKLASGPVRQP
jgi:uncharacterized protein (DUF2062 family)